MRSFARFKDKPHARNMMRAAGIETYAELQRRMAVLYPRGLGPSRQYLSRLMSDDGDLTTSCITAERICHVLGANTAKDRGRLFDFFVPGTRNHVARNGQRERATA